MLLCQNEHDHVGLLIRPILAGSDPTRPRYHAGCIYDEPLAGGKNCVARLVPLGYDLHNLRFNGKRVQATWRTIYVVPSPPNGEAPRATITRLTINCDPQQSFRLPHWLVSRFLALGFAVYEEKWDEQGVQVIRFRFFHLRRSENLVLDLGLCRIDPTARWSKITICYMGNAKLSPQITRAHSCSEHHIDSWNALSKVFSHSPTDADRLVRLSFTPCKMSPGTPQLVVHFELLGCVYEEILRENNMMDAFPTLGTLETSVHSAPPNHTQVSAPRSSTPISSVRRSHAPLESATSKSLTRQQRPRA